MKRKALPKIKKCPAGHVAKVNIDIDGCFYVYCMSNRICWYGPWEKTKRAAILAWNKRV